MDNGRVVGRPPLEGATAAMARLLRRMDEAEAALSALRASTAALEGTITRSGAQIQEALRALEGHKSPQPAATPAAPQRPAANYWAYGLAAAVAGVAAVTVVRGRM
eukprot:tig00000492_g1542.t1